MSRTSYADVYLIFVTNWPAVLPGNKNSSEPCTFDQLGAGGGGNTPTAKNKGKLDTLGIVLCFVTSVFQFKSSPTSPLFETPMISINYVH